MAPAFPEVMDALIAANTGEADSYGHDSHTQKATEMFRDLFGAPVEVRWSLGGTGANVFSLAAVVGAGQSIVTTDSAHIVEHECGAVGRATSAQVRTIPNNRGKLPLEPLRKLIATPHPHESLPRVVSITQATELGTVYAVDEIAAIADVAHAYGSLLHVDGARIANAVAATGASLKTMLTDTGVDIMSFGATKGGTAFGEAVVFLDPKLGQDVKRTHISVGQLSAKTRFIAAQFVAYLEEDRWITRAKNANAMAALLANELTALDKLTVLPFEANIVWVQASDALVDAFSNSVYVEPGRIRWVTAWDTTEQDVHELAKRVASLV